MQVGDIAILANRLNRQFGARLPPGSVIALGLSPTTARMVITDPHGNLTLAVSVAIVRAAEIALLELGAIARARHCHMYDNDPDGAEFLCFWTLARA